MEALAKLISVLGKDVDECEAQLLGADSDLARRNFVRALFAWIEAVAFLMRRAVLCRLNIEPLTPDSIPKFVAASEVSYSVDSKGDVVISRLRTKTSNNLLFSLKSCAALLGLPLDIDKGAKNWQSYSRAVAIRDRITHPKNVGDIEITDEEIELAREAKGMILAYLSVFQSPGLIRYLQDKMEEAMRNNAELEFVLCGDDLKRFGIE